MRISDTAELVLEDCRVPDANVLGKVGHGFIDAMKVLDGRVVFQLLALALGIAAQGPTKQRAWLFQGAHRVRNQPIAGFQAIQFMLADMATEIEAARLLCYRAATCKGCWRTGLPLWSAMAKLYASEVADARDRKDRGADFRRLWVRGGVSGRGSTIATSSCAQSARGRARFSGW